MEMWIIVLMSKIFHSKQIWEGGGHVAGCDGGQSKSAIRGARAGEMTTLLLTVSEPGVFLQLLIKLLD